MDDYRASQLSRVQINTIMDNFFPFVCVQFFKLNWSHPHIAH